MLMNAEQFVNTWVELRDAEAGHEDQLAAALATAAEELRSAADRASDWTLDASGFAAFEGGLARTYRRGQRALKVSFGQPDDRKPPRMAQAE